MTYKREGSKYHDRLRNDFDQSTKEYTYHGGTLAVFDLTIHDFTLYTYQV